jgi:hypothetical protein
MITHRGGVAYDVRLGGTPAKPLYYAMTHCWCGSTLSSGEHFETIGEAIDIAGDSLADHRLRGNHAGKFVRTPCDTCGSVANVDPQPSGAMRCEDCEASR